MQQSSRVTSGATFDRSGKYRYLLWREWRLDLPTCVFIMLNPSTADATTDDPTIRRVTAFAHDFGFGRFDVVNLFAYRATESAVLATVRDPVGKSNNDYILETVSRSDACFAAWGNCGALKQRSKAVMDLLPQHIEVRCLGVNKSGEPKHPLYLPSRTKAIPFR